MKWLEGNITRIKLDDSNRDRRDKSKEWYFDRAQRACCTLEPA
jgi:hypothetical protein